MGFGARMKSTLKFNFRRGSLSPVIVCHCRAVSDRAIREAVRGGACSLRQVARACGAAGRCGGCRPAVAQVIDEETAAATRDATITPAAVAAS